MNVANLQLEGLIMGIAAINHALVRKGLLSVEEIDAALQKAQAGMIDKTRSGDLSSSNKGSVNFPLRALQVANRRARETDLPTFAEVARLVGEMKPVNKDQI